MLIAYSYVYNNKTSVAKCSSHAFVDVCNKQKVDGEMYLMH